MVILAGRGGLCPTNLSECRDLRRTRGNKSRPWRSPPLSGARVAMTQKPPSEIFFTFPSKACDFRWLWCKWQLAAKKPPIRCIARLKPLFLRFLSHVVWLTWHTNHPARTNAGWTEKGG